MNFIRINNGTITLANQGISTHVRLLMYGQNLPVSSSIRIEIIRNFEAIAASNFIDLTGTNTVVANNIAIQNDQRLNDLALDMGAKMSVNHLISMPMDQIEAKHDKVKDIILELPTPYDYKLPPNNSEEGVTLYDAASEIGRPITKTVLNNGSRI